MDDLITHEEESLFTPELLSKVIRTHGIWTWKIEDIPRVVQECRRLNLAIIGSSTLFVFPDGTCELYWLGVDTRKQALLEPWPLFVERTCAEFTNSFDALVMATDFEADALKWPFIRDKKEKGIAILDYLSFEVVIASKKTYSIFANNPRTS